MHNRACVLIIASLAWAGCKSAAAPGGNVATSCHSDSDCAHGEFCDTAFSPSLCVTTDVGDGGTVLSHSFDGGPTSGGGTVCATCMQDSDCGAAGNYCLQDQNGNPGCGTVCQTDTDCPSTDSCIAVTDSTGTTVGNNCFPTSGICPGSTSTSTGTGTVCATCMQNSDCGGTGNYCLQDADGNPGCGTACTTDADCPSGDTCDAIQDANGNAAGSNCFPTSGVCSTTGTGTGAGTVCATCMQNSDCGAAGNYCLQDADGNPGCGTACQSDADCPTGDSCGEVADANGNPVGSNCFPTNGVCP